LDDFKQLSITISIDGCASQPNGKSCDCRIFGTSHIMKITASENDANDIFADVLVTPATIISAFALWCQIINMLVTAKVCQVSSSRSTVSK